MKREPSPRYSNPSFGGFIGVTRCDITPPVGIYNRLWGAATHDRSEGTHRPITATVLAVRQHAEDTPLLLIAIDWPVLATKSNAQLVYEPLLSLTSNDPARVILACSHTHSIGVGFYGPDRYQFPGGDLILPYMIKSRDAIADAARAAIAQSATTRATITWATGRCSLAANRDFPDPDPNKDRWVCGFNPDKPADDTVLVGRVTRDSDHKVIATLVNYACHPTTLAWDCKLASPDYVGAMREVIETHTANAPCLFLQGAAGDLAPAQQYVGDTAVADKHGRQLGYAALSALEGMLSPRQRLAYDGAVESGAPLGAWRLEPYVPSDRFQLLHLEVKLPLVPLPPLPQLQKELAASTDRVMSERLRRKINIINALGTDSTSPQPAWIWRLGDSVLCAQPNEPYSILQERLRTSFPQHAVVFMSSVGVAYGYLYPRELAGRDIYQVWQSPFAAGALETLQAELERAVRSVTSETQPPAVD